MKANGQELVCSLSYDEMAIRQHYEYCKKTHQFIGNVSYGEDRDKIAKEAIIFLVHGINARIQVPVGYHFIHSLDGTDRMKLLLDVLAELFKIGVIISNVTFDGHTANAKMLKLLGVLCFVDDKKETFIIEPTSNRKVYIILDPSHCIKLVRNNLFIRKV